MMPCAPHTVGDLTRLLLGTLFLLAVGALPLAAAEEGSDPSAPAAPPVFTGLAAGAEALLFSGGATTSIPIDVPPGRKSMTPNLAIVYNSGAGVSPYGFGWDLPIGMVQRSRRKGVAACLDEDARKEFVLSLPGAMIECRLDTTHGERVRCRPRVEESYLRIYHTPSANRWDVWDRDGLHYVFGDRVEARTGTTTAAPWIGDYDCLYTQSWAVTRITDPNGNHIDIEHDAEGGRTYPRSIRYGGHSGTLNHLFEVRFIWQQLPVDEIRDERLMSGMAGFPVYVSRFLDRIEVRHPVGGAPVRTYELHYDIDAGATARQGRKGFLQAVTLLGRTGMALARYDDLPAATIFHYAEASAAQRTFHPHSSAAPPVPSGAKAVLYQGVSGTSHSEASVALRDMNGDGVLDLVDARACDHLSNPLWKVYFGSANGFAQTPIYWTLPPLNQQKRCSITFSRIRGRSVETQYETIDLNGDGVPDWIDASTQPWTVYPGKHARSAIEWGFGDAQVWPAYVGDIFEAVPALRVTDDGDDWVDLVDWNGDGLPDLINARRNTVNLNTGTGFSTQFATITAMGGKFRSARDGRVDQGLYDLNGDGLPDLVRATAPNYWLVHFHDGRRFQANPTYVFVQGSCASGIQDKRGGKDTWRDLIDINGDGLPDLVDTCDWSAAHPYWRVHLNRGGRFQTEAIAWQAPYARIREESGKLKPLLHRDTIDIDGDGMVDIIEFPTDSTGVLRVHHNGAGAFVVECGGQCVAPLDRAARPDALVRIENGVGGSTELSYLPSTLWDNSDYQGALRLPALIWTLTRIVKDSGMGTLAPGSSRRQLDIAYAYGLFHVPSREFRGFGTVQTVEADGTRETTIFEQNRASAGRVRSVTTHAPGAVPGRDVPLRAVRNEWQCFDAVGGADKSCSDVMDDPKFVGIRLRATRSFDYAPDGKSRHAWREQVGWSAYGLPTHVRVGGDGSHTIETRTVFAQADDLDAGGSTYNVAKPAHVRVTLNGTTTAEEQWLFYDDLNTGLVTRGNLRRTESWLDSSVVPAPACTAQSSRRCIATVMEYDARGNVVGVVDPAGRRTTTAYGPDQIHPSRIINPAGQFVDLSHDVACGKLLWETLPNSTLRNASRYDDFCRLTATILPGQSETTAQRRYSYYLGGPGVATDISVREAEPHSPSGWVESDELFDGLGRRLQGQKTAVVDGARVVLATDTVRYDDRGNGVASRAPIAITQAFLRGAALYRPVPAGETTFFEYDVLGRVVRTIQPDGTERRADFSIPWQSAATGECFHAPDCDGSRTVKISDAHGNVVEKQIFDQTGQVLAKTQYTHDAFGRVTRVTQWDGVRWQANTRIETAYDSLGRKLLITDPDSGEWLFGYDLVGNLIYQDDPERGRHLRFCYDELSRLTQKHVVSGSDSFKESGHCGDPGAAAVQYVYDDPSIPNGIGRLARIEDTTGMTRFRAYDARGNATAIDKSIRVGAFTETASTEYRYDRAGHLQAMTYPDGEEVRYEYDEVGSMRALRSASDDTVYVADLTYDRFGRPRQITHGNGPGGIGVIDTREYHDGSKGFRLARLTTIAGNASLSCGTGNRLFDLRYERYTANGRIARIDEPTGNCPELSNGATYRYDAMGRVVEVSGAQRNGVYEYDALGNMVAKEGRRFRFSTTRPHRITHIDGAAVVKHDDNGNRTAKPGFVYKFDADDRLIDINNGAVRVAYDYSGRQVLRSAGTIATRYFDEFSEFRIERGEPILTKHYFSGDLRVASRDVIWQPLRTSVDASSAFSVASGWLGHESSRWGLSAILGVGLIGLMLLPDRRCRAQVVRRGQAIAVIAVFLSAQLASVAGPLGASPAWAGGNPGSTTVPLPTVIATPVDLRFIHYHVDHLGTPQALTDAHGGLVEQLRYTLFGEVRGRWNAKQRPVPAVSSFGFAGYQNEELSGLQYAGVRWYDPDLGIFLSHDPARQFPNPYSYGGGDPLNGVDRAGAIFGLDDLLVVVLVGVIAGAAGAGINAAIHGASVGQALKAAAIGGAIGGVSALVGHSVIAPALDQIVVPAITGQVMLTGVSSKTATSIANLAVYGSTVGNGLAQVGIEASRGNFGPLIGLGVAMGLNAALAPLPAAPRSSLHPTPTPGWRGMSVSDLQTGDVLITRDGVMARVTQHAAAVVGAEGEVVLVQSADNRGRYRSTNFDEYVGGRQWDVYRIHNLNHGRFLNQVRRIPTDAGFFDYIGNGGGNVCSSVVAEVIEAGGGPIAPRLIENLVTPQALRETYGPPIGKIYIPKLGGP